MEPAILAIHDFAPTVVGPTEPDRAAAASAHDDTRSQDHPQLHQQAQNVLASKLTTDGGNLTEHNTRFSARKTFGHSPQHPLFCS